MRLILRSLLVFSLCTTFHCIAQTNADQQPEPDIKKFSIAQLIACFGTPGECGDNDTWAIADEFARRKYLAPLLQRYWKEPKFTIRVGIEYVAYRFNTPEVTLFMRRVVKEKIDDGEDRYYPINYLAKQCDRAALKDLSTGRFRGQMSGQQYAASLELFGKCQYRPAIAHLVAELDDFSLNAVIGASDSLDALYPDHPKFEALKDVQKYYCARARKEGFKVDCEHFSDASPDK